MEFEKRVLDLDVNDVLPNRFQPRIKFNEDSINELCESIKEHGVIQPIVVRAMGDKYEIIAGERRYKASLLAGKQTIPAVITELNDKDSAEVALIENVQRKDLTPIEEAISYKKILDMGYLTQEELATKLGKTQSTVANKLRLLNLDEEVQEAVLEEKISERHARSLLKLSNMSEQKKMLDKIIENRLTVRKTDEEISQLLNIVNTDNTTDNFSEEVLISENNNLEEKNENPFKIYPIVSEKVLAPTFDLSNVLEKDSFIEEPIIIIDDPEQLPIINEDQVIVNSTDEFNPFKLEEKDFNIVTSVPENNIPSNPIEDIPSQPIEDSTIQDFNSIQSIEMNPGFMDIEKIETVAQDINNSAVKEEIDINSLLKPSIIGQENPVNVEVPIEQPLNELQSGKFFTLPIDEDKEQEKESLKAENNVTSGLSDAFNFDLDLTESTNLIENAVESPVSYSPLEELKEEEILSPLVNEITSIKEEELSLPFDSKVIEDLSSENLMSPIKKEENQSIEQIANTEVVVQNESNETAIPLIAEEDWTNNLINPNFDFNIGEPTEREEFMAIEPLSSEELPVPNSTTIEVTKKSISDALELIRSNTKQLEKMGYIVDTEEFDFETAYQVIIKIEK